MNFLRVAVLFMVSFGVSANPIFHPQTGELVLPNLSMDGESFYVVLKQVPGTLDFRVDESSVQALSLINGNGTPGSPKHVNFSAANALSSDEFFNYFHLRAAKGQKIIIRTELNTPLTAQERSRCSSNLGTGASPSSYKTQIHMMDARLTRIGGICGESLTFEFPETGTYVMQFAYGAQSAGYFNASIF